jgi:hypothetical protein
LRADALPIHVCFHPQDRQGGKPLAPDIKLSFFLGVIWLREFSPHQFCDQRADYSSALTGCNKILQSENQFAIVIERRRFALV